MAILKAIGKTQNRFSLAEKKSKPERNKWNHQKFNCPPEQDVKRLIYLRIDHET